MENAHKILKKLKAAGYEAYIVGGAARDIIMGRTPNDYDITTNASPEQVTKLFGEKAIRDVGGERFGTLLILSKFVEGCSDGEYEITSFRKDGRYTDGRRPENVSFENVTIEDDVTRRDFTINGLLLEVEEAPNGYFKIKDLVGGEKDLADGIIRCIGNPIDRFEEDRLRMLRAVRFAARYNFNIEDETAFAILSMAHRITECSQERIFQELTKILTEGNAQIGIQKLVELDLMKHILPEYLKLIGCEQHKKWHPEGDVYTHVGIMLSYLPAGCDARLAWSVLLHDIAKPNTQEIKGEKISNKGHDMLGARMSVDILKRFKASNDFIESVRWLVEKHMLMGRGWVKKPNPENRPPETMLKDSTKKNLCIHPDFPHLLELGRLDVLGKLSSDFSQYHAAVQFSKKPMDELNPKSFITGKVLIEELGIEPSEKFGIIIPKLRNLQLNGLVTTKEEAIEKAKKMYLSV